MSVDEHHGDYVVDGTSNQQRDILMPTTTRVFTISHVAEMLAEDPHLLQAIVDNTDNLTFGNIVAVHHDGEQVITALTPQGIVELKEMLAAARHSQKEWTQFLEDFTSDPGMVARFGAIDRA